MPVRSWYARLLSVEGSEIGRVSEFYVVDVDVRYALLHSAHILYKSFTVLLC